METKLIAITGVFLLWTQRESQSLIFWTYFFLEKVLSVFERAELVLLVFVLHLLLRGLEVGDQVLQSLQDFFYWQGDGGSCATVPTEKHKMNTARARASSRDPDERSSGPGSHTGHNALPPRVVFTNDCELTSAD